MSDVNDISYYAYVHFVEDKERMIVPINDIKIKKSQDLNLILSNQFDTQKIYKVKYSDGYFYKANILCVGESPEAVSEILEKKRFHIKPSRYLEGIEDSTADEQTEEENTHTKKKESNKKLLENCARGNYSTLLEEINLKNKNKYTNVEDTDKNIVKEKIKTLENTIQTLKEENVVLKQRNEELRGMNLKFQRDFFSKWEEIQVHLNQGPTITNNEKLEIGERRGDDVHLGRGIFLPYHIYNSVEMKGKTYSKFIRELAVALFGTQVLVGSSVTGVSSNRTKSKTKPPLNAAKVMAIQDTLRHRMTKRGEPSEKIDLICASVTSVIAQKIQDLTRGPRTKRTEKVEDGDTAVEEFIIGENGFLLHETETQSD